MIARVSALWCASISAGVDRASMGGIVLSADWRSSTYSSTSCWNLRSVSASISVVCGGTINSFDTGVQAAAARDPASAIRRSAALRRIMRSSRRAFPTHDLAALVLEDLHPVVERDQPLSFGGTDPFFEALEAGGPEHVADLGVGELREQIGQEPPAALADPRVRERAAQRLLHVGHALPRVLPHGLRSPRLKIDARVVEQRGLAEGQAHVVNVQEGRLAVLVAGLVLDDTAGQAHEALVGGLAVAVLEEDREQLETVALVPGGSAGALIDHVQLGPRPALVIAGLDVLPVEPALDGRGLVALLLYLALAAPEPGLDRAVAAGHLDRIVAVCAEAERPQEPACGHLRVDLAAVVLHLRDVAAPEVAEELGRVAREGLVGGHVVAGHLLVRIEAVLALRTAEEVHLRDAGRPPDGGAPEELRAGLGADAVEPAGAGDLAGVEVRAGGRDRQGEQYGPQGGPRGHAHPQTRPPSSMM